MSEKTQKHRVRLSEGVEVELDRAMIRDAVFCNVCQRRAETRLSGPGYWEPAEQLALCCGGADFDPLCQFCEESAAMEGQDYCAPCIAHGDYPHNLDIDPEVIQQARLDSGVERSEDNWRYRQQRLARYFVNRDRVKLGEISPQDVRTDQERARWDEKVGAAVEAIVRYEAAKAAVIRRQKQTAAIVRAETRERIQVLDHDLEELESNPLLRPQAD